VESGHNQRVPPQAGPMTRQEFKRE